MDLQAEVGDRRRAAHLQVVGGHRVADLLRAEGLLRAAAAVGDLRAVDLYLTGIVIGREGQFDDLPFESVPLQDVLGLGTEARMNLPGSSSGNWRWRFQQGALRTPLAKRMDEMV